MKFYVIGVKVHLRDTLLKLRTGAADCWFFFALCGGLLTFPLNSGILVYFSGSRVRYAVEIKKNRRKIKLLKSDQSALYFTVIT